MPSYKELRAQGLSAYPLAYPTPAINARGESVYIHKRVKWTGNFLNAELEHIEIPAHNFPALIPTDTTAPQQGLTSIDPTMLSHQPFSGKQVLAVSYPSAPERDENGLFPARPENLPTRPLRTAEGTIRERSFGKLITTERSLTVDESIAYDSQFLVDLQRWRSWASRMPQEWNLLSQTEYEEFNGTMSKGALPLADKPDVDKDAQIMLLFALVGLLLLFCGASIGQLLPLVVLVVGVIQINHQNSLDPIDVFRFLTLNPISALYLLGYWVLGMFSVAVIIISSLGTSVLCLLNRVVASSAGTNSEVRNTFYDATAFVLDAKHDFARDISAFRLTLWVAVLLAFSNYKLLQEPSTTCILLCMALCIFLAICVMSSFVERPRSAANDNNPVIPPLTTPPATPAAQVVSTPRVATTLLGRSGVAFADPLSTTRSVKIESLPEGLRPKPLIYDFGTPIRGPLSKDFGARRNPEGLYQVQPTFFTSPPRQTFT
ncbi:hypothetical protein E4T44_04847 [Aureobasidium sp. EXF-8845]|nr:hypothetical protein E4T44_04847 [Aureobasidium sp. EXF-8845]KAI4850952.1 hypothetical protein E4T45_05282 [Aureobasidium sp. EXF-8846]